MRTEIKQNQKVKNVVSRKEMPFKIIQEATEKQKVSSCR